MIFVVEDDAELRSLLLDVLFDAGYRALGCATAHEAAYLISVERPDLLILDVHLEQHAVGWALLAQLRANPATEAVPVILMSADIPFLRLRRTESHVPHCFAIEKPFGADDLLTTVYAALGVVPAELANGA
jgi:DNA-binding response OmpR family regulator